jgi:hypothetical protein
MKHFAHQIRVVFLFSLICWSQPLYAAMEWAGMEWHPTLSIDETYDSNVTFAASDEKEDFVTAIAPGIEGIHDGKTQYMRFKGTLHEKLYAKESEFNNFSQDFVADYKKEFSEYNRIALGNTFLHADNPGSLDDEFGRGSGRYDFIKNLFHATWAHNFSSQLTGSVRYTNDYYGPDRDDLPTTDANRIALQSDYAINSQTIPYLLYEYSQREYEPGGTISRNTIGGGVKHFLTEQVYVNSRIAADFIDPVGGEEITKPNFLVGIYDQPDEKTTYGAYFSKHYEDSSYDQNLLNSWRFSLSWGRELTERLKMLVTAFTGGGKFEPDGAKERLDGVGTVLEYELTRNSALSAGFRVSKKNSSDDTRDYDKNTFSINWKIKF